VALVIPRMRVVAIARMTGSATRRMDPSLTRYATPKKTNAVASVAMKALIRPFATTRPLMSPQTTPTAAPTASSPIPEPRWLCRRRATRGARMKIADNDTSKPPAMRTIVANTATINVIACWSRMLRTLSVLRNDGVVSDSSTISARVTHTMP